MKNWYHPGGRHRTQITPKGIRPGADPTPVSPQRPNLSHLSPLTRGGGGSNRFRSILLVSPGWSSRKTLVAWCIPISAFFKANPPYRGVVGGGWHLFPWGLLRKALAAIYKLYNDFFIDMPQFYYFIKNYYHSYFFDPSKSI